MGRQQMVYRVSPAPFPKDFPERLEKFRMAAGLSRRELARRLCTDVRLLKRWNNGTRPDPAYLVALFVLAAGLGLLHLMLPEVEDAWEKGGDVERRGE